MTQSSRSKQSKEKRNPLLDQVKHTGLTHFKPNSTVKHNHGDTICTIGVRSDDVDDDDDDMTTITSRLKAISDRYLKSSTHRFLAKFYKNSSTKIDDKSTDNQEPDTKENQINKVGKQINNADKTLWLKYIIINQWSKLKINRFKLITYYNNNILLKVKNKYIFKILPTF